MGHWDSWVMRIRLWTASRSSIRTRSDPAIRLRLNNPKDKEDILIISLRLNGVSFGGRETSNGNVTPEYEKYDTEIPSLSSVPATFEFFGAVNVNYICALLQFICELYVVIAGITTFMSHPD